ncbi:family 20 glycosylhydrolase [Mariniflexile ostreae]|uniref:Family 20 glycosylhydrolase n=1 Tax=Mariniflexile ostreae TaxID=1520892 RepID=A0ABV5FBD2_9FLAO
MKFKIAVLYFLLFSSHFIFAKDNISKYLLFSPQKIEVGASGISIEKSQIKAFENFLVLSIRQKSRGEWQFLADKKYLNVCFEVDTNFTYHDYYKLTIDTSGIKLAAKNENALKYGKQTLLQVLEYAKSENKPLQKIIIEDWANFERRGYMLDVSRDKIPTMESLYLLIDQLANWRINELQLYTEHTFAYKNHEVVWKNASPLTAIEIQQLNAYCLEKGIDLVPNQNSFGHMENWLKHDEYLELSECETDCNTIWGKRKRTALAPTNPKSLELMQELYAELLPNFTSKYVNIGGDETVELGLGKSKALSNKIGKGQVYLDFLEMLNTEINLHGKQTLFWGDIVLNHPELIKDIPKSMTALVWGYDATYPFDRNLAKFHDAGLDFYVCPGTSSWRSEIGRNRNGFKNLKHAAIQGKKYGAKGFLITDWGDYGHFQPKSVSYATLLLGAGYAWNYSDAALDQLPARLNKYVFEDPTGYTAKALLTLGDSYLKAQIPEGNANAFHLMIRRYNWTMKGHYQTKKLNEKGLLAAKKEILKGLDFLTKAKPTAVDSKIIIEESNQAAHLALFGINLGVARLKAKGMKTENIPKSTRQELANELKDLIENHKTIWLVRNREGGLSDSSSKLEDLLNFLEQ